MTAPVPKVTAKKDVWEILQSLAPIIASIAVPLAIAWVGGAYNATIKDSENRVRYIELAIAQLRSPPTPETAALREWATELLDSQSPVKLSSAAKAQLKSSALPLVVSASAPGAVLTGTSMLTGGGASATNDGKPRLPSSASQSQ